MVLVTGGSGLVGSEVINQLLLKGISVRAIYNNTKIEIPANENLELIPASILDVVALEKSMKGVTGVYHCAGLVSYANGMSGQLYKINVEGTSNVVNAAIEAGVRKMVHVSSVAALDHSEAEMITESSQWNAGRNTSNYSKSKYLGEMEVWRGIAEGLNAIIINPSIILGGGNWDKGSTAIFKSVYNQFPWYSEGVTGFVDVKDVAAAMIISMESEISNQRYIISAVNESYKNVFETIAECFNRKIPHKKVNKILASVVWRLEKFRSIFTGKEPLITRETASAALAVIRYDNSKFLKDFPSFSYTQLNHTIKATCISLQQKLNKP